MKWLASPPARHSYRGLCMSLRGARAARRSARGLQRRPPGGWRSRDRRALRATRSRARVAPARAPGRAGAAQSAASPETAGDTGNWCLRGPGSPAGHSSGRASQGSWLTHLPRGLRRKEIRTACRESTCGAGNPHDLARASPAARRAGNRPPPGHRLRSARAQHPRSAGRAATAPPGRAPRASPRFGPSACQAHRLRGAPQPRSAAHSPLSESSPGHRCAARRPSDALVGFPPAGLARIWTPAQAANPTASSALRRQGRRTSRAC